MVFICYRRWYLNCGLGCGSFPAEGWYCAYLPGDVYVDNGTRRISACHAVNALQMIQYPRFEHLVHEFGHAWGLNHQYAGGFWSLMGHRYPTNSSFMNSVEREQLGWIAFHDISTSQTASLRDFGTDGDAYRISIGNGEYFILENHQIGSLYDYPSIDATRGLYVIRKVPGFENTLSVETARGRYNWTNPSWTHYPTNGAWIPVFRQEGSNRTSGSNERTPLFAIEPITSDSGYHLVQAKVDPVTGQTVFIGFCTCGFFRGSYGDQFDATNCAVFSPWSYPSACTRSGSLTNIGFECCLRPLQYLISSSSLEIPRAVRPPSRTTCMLLFTSTSPRIGILASLGLRCLNRMLPTEETFSCIVAPKSKVRHGVHGHSSQRNREIARVTQT